MARNCMLAGIIHDRIGCSRDFTVAIFIRTCHCFGFAFVRPDLLFSV